MNLFIKMIFIFTGTVSYSLFAHSSITVYNVTDYTLNISVDAAKFEGSMPVAIAPLQFSIISGGYKGAVAPADCCISVTIHIANTKTGATYASVIPLDPSIVRNGYTCTDYVVRIKETVQETATGPVSSLHAELTSRR
jgi:hypothetical protein